MNYYLLTYCILTYVVGILIIRDRYKLKKSLDTRDIIILILSPVGIMPIVISPFVSLFIDLSKPIIKKYD